MMNGLAIRQTMVVSPLTSTWLWKCDEHAINVPLQYGLHL